MATLAIIANRRRDDVVLFATETSVALDASVSVQYDPPAGIGDLIVSSAWVTQGSLSGAYAAPTPNFDGPWLAIIQTNAPSAAKVDSVGASRWVLSGTQSARPFLVAQFDLNRDLIVRMNESFQVNLPVAAGAGVTASIQLYVRARRLRQA